MSANHMTEFDPECTDLMLVHGELRTMECLHPWSDERYENTLNPFSLSGMYKLTFSDGVEVIVGSLYAYALAQGSFWLIEDPTDKATSVFVREDRALAYFASKGSILQRDREGLCELPSQSEAEEILAGFGVPDEALKFGSEEVLKGCDRWGDQWLKQGLVKKDKDGRCLIMKVRKQMPTEKSPLLYVNALDGKEYLAGRHWFGEKYGYLVVSEGDVFGTMPVPSSIGHDKAASWRAEHLKIMEICGVTDSVIKMSKRALGGLVRARSATEMYGRLGQFVPEQCIHDHFHTVWTKVKRYNKIKEWRRAQRSSDDTGKNKGEIMVKSSTIRVFAISDIHETDVTTLDPSGYDIAILAGDIQGHTCSRHLKVDFGSRRITEQIAWVDGIFLPWCAKYKDVQFVVVAGNNDEFALSPQNPLRHLSAGSNVHYLQDSGIEIKGVKIWGSPWTKPKNHRIHCPADQLKMFERTADDLRKALMEMPEGVDVLVTHATPEVPGSHVAGVPEHHYGSEVLKEVILAKKPKTCVCGHVHAKDHSPVKLGETLVMNVSRIHESRHKAEFPPRVFTIKKADGVTEVHVKEWVM